MRFLVDWTYKDRRLKRTDVCSAIITYANKIGTRGWKKRPWNMNINVKIGSRYGGRFFEVRIVKEKSMAGVGQKRVRRSSEVEIEKWERL